jgi:hypothetical protein
MLKLLWRPLPGPRTTPEPSREDLQIRNLLDDPALRRVMGLDADPPSAKIRRHRTHGVAVHRSDGSPHGAPGRRFDRRRLLDDAVA